MNREINYDLLIEAEKLANIAHFEIDIPSGEMVCSDQLYRIVDEGVDAIRKYHTSKAITYIHPEDKRMVLDTYYKCIHEDSPINLRFRIITNKGKTKYIHNIGKLNNKDIDNTSTTIFSAILDVTKQYKIEEKLNKLNSELESRVIKRTQELEQNQFLYKMIARNFPNGTISVFDRNLNYVFVEGKELFKRGITGDVLVGTSFLNRVDPLVKDDIEAKLKSALNGESVDFELHTEDKTYMVNVGGIKTINEQNSHILMVSQNITPLKNAEREIKKTLEKEMHLNEMKSRFVSMASHEFRTPLTSILNSTSLINKYKNNGGNDEKERNHLKRISSSAKNLTAILNDFLSLEKLESNKKVFNAETINVEDFLKDLIIGFEGVLKKGQVIKYTHTGSKFLLIDIQLLTNVYNNLLSNAVKFSNENSEIIITTEIDTSNFIFKVKDSGIGIPIEEQEQLFNRFFRARNAVNIEGTGLGLSIVKYYVDMLCGEMSFTSEENKGTEIKIKLPLD